ncbi:MAG TPA: M28 family peptidase, partial [Phnomibacter sp.]|nr:M28 family peptidase [Phnomibacter sp.]
MVSPLFRFPVCILVFLISLSSFTPTAAQPLVADSARVARWMTTLSAPGMYGRGYVKGGLDSAAAFIVRELQTLGLQANRLPFKMPVNTFPHKVQLAINGRKLLPGKDFLVGPESVSFHGAASLEQADSNVWVDARRKIIFETADKLSWSVATEQAAFTRFTVAKRAWPSALRKVEAEVEAVYDSSFTASNILAVIPGTRRPDSMLVFTAHYDHLGMMGANTTFAGANDNASGTALLLALAAYYATHPAAYSVAFLFFAGEEAGLYGSKVFTDQPVFPLDKVRFLLNLDLMGNGDEG